MVALWEWVLKPSESGSVYLLGSRTSSAGKGHSKVIGHACGTSAVFKLTLTSIVACDRRGLIVDIGLGFRSGSLQELILRRRHRKFGRT